MDYNANQTEIPYILDEFSQMVCKYRATFPLIWTTIRVARHVPEALKFGKSLGLSHCSDFCLEDGMLTPKSLQWETPFSPTNQSFPCSQQRPPNLSRQAAENRMYLANHNLNTEIALAGTSLLVPTTALINQTNALNGSGSLGLMANNCAGKLD